MSARRTSKLCYCLAIVGLCALSMWLFPLLPKPLSAWAFIPVIEVVAIGALGRRADDPFVTLTGVVLLCGTFYYTHPLSFIPSLFLCVPAYCFYILALSIIALAAHQGMDESIADLQRSFRLMVGPRKRTAKDKVVLWIAAVIATYAVTGWILSAAAGVELWPFHVVRPFVLILFVTSIASFCLFPTYQPPPEGQCKGCGYNLTGNVSGRCPECGRLVSGSAKDALSKVEPETAASSSSEDRID